MSVTVLVDVAAEAAPLIALAARLGRARQAAVNALVVLPGTKSSAGQRLTTAADEAAAAANALHADPDEPDATPLVVVHAVKPGEAPVDAALAAVQEHDTALLILGKHEPPRAGEETLDAALFRRARCAVLAVRPGVNAPDPTQPDTPGPRPHILVPTAGGPHAEEALKLAVQLAGTYAASEATVDALYVEPDLGPEARAVGQRRVEKAVRGALKVPPEHAGPPPVRALVELATDHRAGILRAAEAGDYGLVLMGAPDRHHARRALFGSVPDKLMKACDAGRLSIGVVRPAPPLSEHAAHAAREVFERFVPQLTRDDRVDLVERIQGASRWDVDFVALMSLSTVIATFGLMQNSAAVVIGAMLVAPLMTPLIGCGLALVQGNAHLVRHAVKAVVLGFVLAFGIALIMGLVVPHAGATPQLLSRGAPNLLDLGVAFASGLAAAYATARPNLSGALPGVAIAAALVPPISTAGVSLAQGNVDTGLGAATLFGVNIVAIVLGAALALWAVGMEPADTGRKGKAWRRPAAAALTAVTLALAIPLSWWLYASLPHRPVPGEVRDALARWVQAEPGATLTDVSPPESDGESLVFELTREAPEAPGPRLAAALARELSDHYNQPCRVRLMTRLVNDTQAPR